MIYTNNSKAGEEHVFQVLFLDWDILTFNCHDKKRLAVISLFH